MVRKFSHLLLEADDVRLHLTVKLATSRKDGVFDVGALHGAYVVISFRSSRSSDRAAATTVGNAVSNNSPSGTRCFGSL